MLSSWLATLVYSRKFGEEWDSPPTTVAKAHHFRSVVQAQVGESPQYELNKDYIEFGRVQVTDTKFGRIYLIRSMSAVAIEDGSVQPTLFEIPRAFEVNMLIYKFEPAGMRLWRCATAQADGRKRLIPVGELIRVGFWRFDDFAPDGGGVFDQGENDGWDDLGNPDIEAGGGL